MGRRRRLNEDMDEVPGRGASCSGQSDDLDQHVNDITCDLCTKAGHVISAAVYCQSCREFLCNTCIIQHNRFSALKDHTLLTGENMPSQRPTYVAVDKCSIHPDRPLEMYCSDEDMLGCTLCFSIGHKSCQKVNMISDVSKGIKSSEAFSEIQKASKKQKEICNKLKELIRRYRYTNDQCHHNCLEDFKGFRLDVEKLLDNLGEQVSMEACLLKQENTDKLDKLVNAFSSYEIQVESNMKHIDLCAAMKQNDQLFIAVKKNEALILKSVQTLEEIYDDIDFKEFHFTYDLTSVKVSLDNMYEIRRKQALKPATKVADVSKVYIQSLSDKDECYVRGIMALSDTALVLTDRLNSCLKLFDMNSNTIIKKLSLSSPPQDVCRLSGSCFAVTLPDVRRIGYYTADAAMDPCGSIPLAGRCWGLECMGDHLVISYTSPEAQVQIVDLQGTVMQSIHLTSSGNRLFNCPEYITVSAENKEIYVSDFNKNTLTCLTSSGVVQWVYKDDELKRPAGVTLGDGGCIYICSLGTHSIHVVSADGVRLALIHRSQSGLKDPRAVCYNRELRKLYVSSTSAASVDCSYIHIICLQ